MEPRFRRFQEELARPITRWEIGLEIAALAGLMATVAIVAIHWRALPDPMPFHFSRHGRPDAYGSPVIVWFFYFLVQIAIHTGLTALPSRVPPDTWTFSHLVTEENAPRMARVARFAVRITKVYCMWVSAVVAWSIVGASLGRPIHVGDGLGIATAALVILITFLDRIDHWITGRRGQREGEDNPG